MGLKEADGLAHDYTTVILWQRQKLTPNPHGTNSMYFPYYILHPNY